MTKKHFIAIAATIHQALAAAKGPVTRKILSDLAKQQAAAFAAANPAFNRAKFLEACGVQA